MTVLYRRQYALNRQVLVTNVKKPTGTILTGRVRAYDKTPQFGITYRYIAGTTYRYKGGIIYRYNGGIAYRCKSGTATGTKVELLSGINNINRQGWVALGKILTDAFIKVNVLYRMLSRRLSP